LNINRTIGNRIIIAMDGINYLLSGEYPGIYVRENVLDILPKTQRNEALAAKLRPAVTKYRNIGVRIEDDYLITDQGVEWISRAPRESNEVEALMREALAGGPKRDTGKLDWYKRTAGPQAP
jgi:predicted sulfurtransferase